LGKGGMGMVFRAVQEALKSEVAVKVIRAHLLERGDAVQRFEREAQSVAKLRGKTIHVVQVYGFGRDEATGHHYLVMELVEGEGVDSLLAREGIVPPRDACDIIRQAALGLEAAHQHGLVHRDIKPENLLITPDGVVKVTDFGLAKAAGAGTDISVSGQILGTPAYMSPEQAQAKPVDARTDIYSLGATLFALVSGRPPFQADTALAMCMLHVSEPVPDLRTEAPDAPKELAELIQWCMAKSPADRPASAAEVARALEQIIAVAPALPPAPGQATLSLTVVLRPEDGKATESPPPPKPEPRPVPEQPNIHLNPHDPEDDRVADNSPDDASLLQKYRTLVRTKRFLAVVFVLAAGFSALLLLMQQGDLDELEPHIWLSAVSPLLMVVIVRTFVTSAIFKDPAHYRRARVLAGYPPPLDRSLPDDHVTATDQRHLKQLIWAAIFGFLMTVGLGIAGGLWRYSMLRPGQRVMPTEFRRAPAERPAERPARYFHTGGLRKSRGVVTLVAWHCEHWPVMAL
jgi:serine/threonine-protein kinase